MTETNEAEMTKQILCEGACKGHTEHVPVDRRLTKNGKAVEVIYRCTGCGTERRYGLEQPGA